MAIDTSKSHLSLLKDIKKLLGDILEKIAGGAPTGEATSTPEEVPEKKQPFAEILSTDLSNIFSSIGEKLGLTGQQQARQKVSDLEEKYEEQKADLLQKVNETKEAAEIFRQAQLDVATATRELERAEKEREERVSTRQAGSDELDALDSEVSRLRGAVTEAWKAMQQIKQEQGGDYEKAQRRETEARRGLEKTSGQLGDARAEQVLQASKQGSIDFKKMSEGLSQAGGVASQFGFGGGGTDNLGQALNEGDIGGIFEHGAQIAQNIPLAMEGDPQAILYLVKEGFELVKQNMEAIVEHVKNIGRQADKFMTSDKLEDDLGATFGAAREAGGAMVRGAGGPILGPILDKMIDMHPAVQFADALVKSISTLRRWNDAIHESNMRFAQFSASMSMVQARAEMRRIYLEQERGERRAGTAEYHEQGKIQIDRRMALWEDTFANVKNIVVGTLDRVIDILLDMMPMVTILEKIAEKFNILVGGKKGVGFTTPLDVESENEARRRWGNNIPPSWVRRQI